MILKTLLLSLLFISINSFAAQTHGNGALEVFDNAGMQASPLWVQLWIGFMMLMFFSGLAFVKNHAISRWVVGGFIGGMVALLVMQKAFGIIPLSGLIALIHLIFWSAGLFQLLRHKPFLKQRSAFSIWSGLMTATLLFSFFFDIRDSIIYLQYLAH